MSALFALLQITDSAFPSGSFAHSYGLEGLFEGRLTPSLDEVRGAIDAVWWHQLLRMDGVGGRRAHRAMQDGDVDRVTAIDQELFDTKIARELREASIATGRGFLSVARSVVVHTGLEEYATRVETRRSPGTHAIAFHAAAAAAGVGAAETTIAWGYQTIAQMVSALLRLGILGHRDAQAHIAALCPRVAQGAREIAECDEGGLSSFAPALEIASMRHERQYSRLFRS